MKKFKYSRRAKKDVMIFLTISNLLYNQELSFIGNADRELGCSKFLITVLHKEENVNFDLFTQKLLLDYIAQNKRKPSEE